jgi:hypothetical protein
LGSNDSTSFRRAKRAFERIRRDNDFLDHKISLSGMSPWR